MKKTEIPEPRAEKIDKVMTIHDHQRTDEFYWLNERDNPKVIETLNFINNLKKSGAITPGFASRTGGVDLEEFIAGRTGFLISPGVHASAIGSRNPDLNHVLVRVPTNGVNAYRVHGWELGIASKSKHKNEAWKFIDFLRFFNENL